MEAVAIAAFEIYGWKCSGYVILIMLFQLVLTKFFISDLFSCLPKVDHVTCKEPIITTFVLNTLTKKRHFSAWTENNIQLVLNADLFHKFHIDNCNLIFSTGDLLLYFLPLCSLYHKYMWFSCKYWLLIYVIYSNIIF